MHVKIEMHVTEKNKFSTILGPSILFKNLLNGETQVEGHLAGKRFRPVTIISQSHYRYIHCKLPSDRKRVN